MAPISAMTISVLGLTFGGVVGRDPALAVRGVACFSMLGDCTLGLRLVV